MKPTAKFFLSTVFLILVFCSGAVVATESLAREFDWAQVSSINLSSNPTYLRSSLALTPDGEPVRAYLTQNHYLLGLLYLGDFQLEQYSANRNLVWSHELLGKVHIQGIETDSENALLVYGTYMESIIFDETHQLTGEVGQPRGFILKLDASRDVVWFIDPGIENPDISSIENLTIDHQDNVWIGTLQPVQQSALHRLNSGGSIAESYLQNGVRTISDLAVDSDGTIWATGSCSNGDFSFNGLVSSSPYEYAVYLVRYSPEGLGQWVKYVEDVTFQSPQVECDGSGRAYLAGALNGSFSFGDLLAEGPAWGTDFFLTRIDASGEFLWLKEVPASSPSSSAGPGVGGSIFCHTDGSVFFAGFSRNSIDWNSDGLAAPAFGWTDALVLNFSPEGEFLLTKTAGSSWYDIADAVAVDSLGNIFLAGQVNPFNPKISISFELPSPSMVSLGIYDTAGHLVKQLINSRFNEAGSHAVSWMGLSSEGRAMPSGMYFYRLDVGGLSAMKKVTLLR